MKSTSKFAVFSVLPSNPEFNVSVRLRAEAPPFVPNYFDSFKSSDEDSRAESSLIGKEEKKKRHQNGEDIRQRDHAQHYCGPNRKDATTKSMNPKTDFNSSRRIQNNKNPPKSFKNVVLEHVLEQVPYVVANLDNRSEVEKSVLSHRASPPLSKHSSRKPASSACMRLPSLSKATKGQSKHQQKDSSYESLEKLVCDHHGPCPPRLEKLSRTSIQRSRQWRLGVVHSSEDSFKIDQNSNENDNGGVEATNGNASVVKFITSSNDQTAITPFRRPKTDMTLLRDRWWGAIKRHRQKTELQKELITALKTRHVDPVAIELEHCSAVVAERQKSNISEDSGDSHVTHQDISCEGVVSLGSGIALSLMALPKKDAAEEIVRKSDKASLSYLLKVATSNNLEEGFYESGADGFEMLLQCFVDSSIRHNKPHMLRKTLMVGSNVSGREARASSDSLLQAVELGHEECVSVLLSRMDQQCTGLFCKDVFGNNILHYCCRGLGDISLLQMIVKNIPGSTKGRQQRLAKLIAERNHSFHATPLHEACRCSRVEFVEFFLKFCNRATLSKILAMTDTSSQTPLMTAISSNSRDVVTALLMLRYNHSQAPPKLKYDKYSCRRATAVSFATSRVTCPLAWAANNGNLEMIDLLLQFGDQSAKAYRLTEALICLLKSESSFDVKVKGAELLTQVFANPFEVLPTTGETKSSDSAISFAANVLGSPLLLRTLIKSGTTVLKSRQLARRKDPKLRLQPEAFFRALESKENAEMTDSMKQSLLESLLGGSLQQDLIHFAVADVFYGLDVKLDESDIHRLYAALKTKVLSSISPTLKASCIAAKYDVKLSPDSVENATLENIESDRSPLAANSRLLLEIGLPKEHLICRCPWLTEMSSTKTKSVSSQDNFVVLTSHDGASFNVHEFILAEKSAKFDSAIRFHKMHGDHNGDVELNVPIGAELLQSMIHHFYHGSLSFWPDLSQQELGSYLLELWVVAEEFLCADLMQEIQMRLLSSDPLKCFCWSCCQMVSIHPSHSWTAQCIYCVDGKSSLMTQSSVFEILGIIENMLASDCEFFLLPVNLLSVRSLQLNRLPMREGLRVQSLKLLRDCIDLRLLASFGEFRAQVAEKLHENDLQNDGEESSKYALLRMCVNKLRNNSLVGFVERKSAPLVLAKTTTPRLVSDNRSSFTIEDGEESYS